jgi:hypothetical protein
VFTIHHSSALIEKTEDPMSQHTAQHHGQAAYHHESATKHHRAAENAYGSGDHKAAAAEAKLAAGHAAKAKEFADLADASHSEHYGMKPGVPTKPAL